MQNMPKEWGIIRLCCLLLGLKHYWTMVLQLLFKFNIKYVNMRLFKHKKSHGKFVLNPIVEVVGYFVLKNENQHIFIILLLTSKTNNQL